MQNINNWMLQTIQQEAQRINRMPLQWLEMVRNTWTPLVIKATSFILSGGTFLICTDPQRAWLKHYILSHLNTVNNDRPLLPFYALDYSLITLIEQQQNDLVRDMLDISHANYAMWYIGSSDSALAQFSLEFPDSLIWMLNESLDSSFVLHADDPDLAFKLLQAYSVFEKTLFAGIFGEFNLEANY